MNLSSLPELISGCKSKNPGSQKKLFMLLYGYALGIARRYGATNEDAEEIANDGFYKAFTKIEKYQDHIPFQLWLRKIIINTGIDHYRKHKNERIDSGPYTVKTIQNQGAQNLDQEYLLNILNKLSPQYKLVFVLNVIEGYKHDEIAELLNISVGTSKSNLSKARKRLKELINEFKENEKFERQSVR